MRRPSEDADDLLAALGRAARDDRAAADALLERAPVLTEHERARMVERAFAELDSAQREPGAPRDRRAARRRPAARWAALGAGLALAAAVAALVSTRHEPLPGYRLSLGGATAEWRATAATAGDSATARADSTIEILARPDTPVSEALEARAFASTAGMTKPLPVELSKQGVARVAGRADAVLGPAGTRWRVVIVIGARGTVPSAPEAARSRSDLRVVEASLTVTETSGT